MTTATDIRFGQVLAERLGQRFVDVRAQAAAIEGEGQRAELAGVPRPAGVGLRFYVAHHAGPDSERSTWDSIWRFHVGSRRWSTGGYHAIIDSGGRLFWTVNPSRMTYGAGPAWNPSTVHACLPGDFRRVAPTPAALESLYQWFCTCDDVLGYRGWRAHGELKATECPGAVLRSHVREMARRGALKPRPASYRG